MRSLRRTDGRKNVLNMRSEESLIATEKCLACKALVKYARVFVTGNIFILKQP